MSSELASNPYAPPQAEVKDLVQDNVQLASRALRLGAWAIDTVIGFLLALPLLIGASFGMFHDRPPALTDAALVGFAITILGGIVWTIVTIVLVHRNGQTIGKKLVGVKVVRSNGARASLGRIFWLRNVVNALLNGVPYLGSVYFLIDHAFIFGDKCQCLHDKIADTIVVMA